MPDSEPSSETRESDGGQNSCSTTPSEPPNTSRQRAGRIAHNSCHRPATVTAAVFAQDDDDAVHCRRGTGRRMHDLARFPPLSAAAVDDDFGRTSAYSQCLRVQRKSSPPPTVCVSRRLEFRAGRCIWVPLSLFFFPPCCFLAFETAVRDHVRGLLSLFTPCFACKAGDVGCQSPRTILRLDSCAVKSVVCLLPFSAVT